MDSLPLKALYMIPRLNVGEALELELKPTMTVQVVTGKIAFNLTCGNTLYVYLHFFQFYPQLCYQSISFNFIKLTIGRILQNKSSQQEIVASKQIYPFHSEHLK